MNLLLPDADLQRLTYLPTAATAIYTPQLNTITDGYLCIVELQHFTLVISGSGISNKTYYKIRAELSSWKPDSTYLAHIVSYHRLER